MANICISVLENYIGTDESHFLEFKSSAVLAMCDKNSADKFIRTNLVPATSSMLNADGGRIIVGLEEDKKRNAPSTAKQLSAGVSVRFMTAEKLETQICALIQPSCANYVQVHQATVSPDGSSERLLAFVIDVKRGITAYQSSDDYLYWVRREYSCIQMEDKDIRLRMLSDDKPRVSLMFKVSFSDGVGQAIEAIEQARREFGGLTRVPRSERLEAVIAKRAKVWMPPSEKLPPTIGWWVDLVIQNSGLVSVNKAWLQGKVDFGDIVDGIKVDMSAVRKMLSWGIKDNDELLFPEMTVSETISRGTIDLELMSEAFPKLVLNASASMFLDNGPAFRLDSSELLTNEFGDAASTCMRQIAEWDALLKIWRAEWEGAPDH